MKQMPIGSTEGENWSLVCLISSGKLKSQKDKQQAQGTKKKSHSHLVGQAPHETASSKISDNRR